MHKIKHYELRVSTPTSGGSIVLSSNFRPTADELLTLVILTISNVPPREHHENILDFLRELVLRQVPIVNGYVRLKIAGTEVGCVSVTESEIWSRSTEPEDLPHEALRPAPAIIDDRFNWTPQPVRVEGRLEGQIEHAPPEAMARMDFIERYEREVGKPYVPPKAEPSYGFPVLAPGGPEDDVD